MRGAAIIAEESGDRLLMARALARHFDADGDGFLRAADLQNLLNATRKNEDDDLLEVNDDIWEQILNDTGSDASRGLDSQGLLALYTLPGEDLKADFFKVFGASIRSLQQLPIALHPFPDPCQAELDPLLGRLRDPALSSQLRRWQLEAGFVAPSAELWERRPPEDCVDARADLHWHEWDWAEHDHRLVRDFLFELSLTFDIKQRPTQAEGPDLAGPPPLYSATTQMPVAPSPVHMYGLTWPEYMDRIARESPSYTDFRFYPNPRPPGPPPPSPLSSSPPLRRRGGGGRRPARHGRPFPDAHIPCLLHRHRRASAAAADAAAARVCGHSTATAAGVKRVWRSSDRGHGRGPAAGDSTGTCDVKSGCGGGGGRRRSWVRPPESAARGAGAWRGCAVGRLLRRGDGAETAPRRAAAKRDGGRKRLQRRR